MSQRNEPQKKKTNVVLIIVIVVVIVLLLVVGLIIFLILRVRNAVQKGTNCTSDADCVLGFKCNTSTKICSQCLTNADCSDGKLCVGPVCTCPLPVITDATVTVLGAWPPSIQVFVDSTGGNYETMKYKINFVNSVGSFATEEDFLPNPGTTAPTFTFDFPSTCDGFYTGYGCPSDCGPGHTIQGKVTVQIQNECGSISQVKTIPLSGNCDFCTQPTC